MSGLEKNVASQKWLVFAYDLDGLPVASDAANITAKIRKDFAAAASVTDTNPTEIEDGYYEFDLTQAETNAKVLDLLPQSSTTGVYVVGVPRRVFTVPSGFATAAVQTVAQTGDAYARLGAPAGASVSADIAAAKADTAAIKAKTDTLPSDPADASVIAGLIAAVQAVVDAVQAKTDNLPSDPADASVLAGLLSTLQTAADAIKAKTDNLPTDPADASVIAGLIATLQTTADTINTATGTTLPAMLATIAGYLDTEIAAIKSKTDNLPSDPADASVVAGLIAALQAVADAIQAKTDLLPASPAATGDIPSAATNAAAVRTNLATELGRIDATVSSRSSHSAADVKTAMEASGSQLEQLHNTLASDGVFSEAALANAPTGEGGGSGSGSELVSIIAVDGSDDPIQGIPLRLLDISGNLAASGTSDGDGDTGIESLNPATYTPSGHVSGLWQIVAGQTVVVTEGGDNEFRIEFEALSSPPPSTEPDTLTLGVYAIQMNEAEDGYEPAGAGIEFHVQITDGDVAGLSAPYDVLTATTGADSRAYFVNFPNGVRYDAWRGTATTRKKQARTPDTGDTAELPFLVGSP